MMDHFNESSEDFIWPFQSNFTLSYEDIQVLEHLQHIGNVCAIVAQVVILTFLFIGLIGNIVVIYTSTFTQRIINHPIHSRLVVNLAFSDIIYLISSAPYQISLFSSPRWVYSSFLCPTLHFLNLLAMNASIFTICTLAILRFLALIMPYEVHSSFAVHSKKHTGSGIIAVVWMVAICLSLPSAVFYRLQKVKYFSPLNETVSAAEYCKWETEASESIYILCLLLFTYVFPGILVSVLYFIVGKELLCHMNKNAQSVHCQDRTAYWKTTKTVLILVIAFLLCWFPYNLYLFLTKVLMVTTFDVGVANMILELIGYCLSYAHACINPIIYTFAVPSFQQNLKKMFTLQKLRQIFSSWSLHKATSRRTSLTTVFSRRKRSKGEAATFLSHLSSVESPSDEREFFTSFKIATVGRSSAVELL